MKFAEDILLDVRESRLDHTEFYFASRELYRELDLVARLKKEDKHGCFTRLLPSSVRRPKTAERSFSECHI